MTADTNAAHTVTLLIHVTMLQGCVREDVNQDGQGTRVIMVSV